MDFQEKQEKLINEVIDVFKRNDADIFEMYRALGIMHKYAQQVLKEKLGEFADELEKVVGELKAEDESEESE